MAAGARGLWLIGASWLGVGRKGEVGEGGGLGLELYVGASRAGRSKLADGASGGEAFEVGR